MNTYLVIERYLPGFMPEQQRAAAGAAKTITASIALTPIAPRRHDAADSLVSAWLMIATIFGCLAIMAAVVLVAATSIP
jgi:hypothetical protein